MKPLVSLAIVFSVTTAAVGRPAPSGPWSTGRPNGRPHPAVVRVVVPDGTGFSFGSGALVAVGESHGLVVTNWHVIRDAAGQIVVVFPDGFRSGATVLRTDRDWDLAALAIQRPHVAPIPLAAQAPRPGEPLTIAGYGSGQYRESTGRCTQYVSPGRNHPFEMVELSAGAREGDSGGPIFNRRGELAGVLFGAAWGHTTGSYCRRVGWFLDSVAADFQRLEADSVMIAQRPQFAPAGAAEQPPNGRGAIARPPRPPRAPDVQRPQGTPRSVARASQAPSAQARGEAPSAPVPTVSIQAKPPLEAVPSPSQPPVGSPEIGRVLSEPQSDPGGGTSQLEATEPLRWEDVAGRTLSEQIKTILAGMGVLAIFLHGLRLLSRAERS